MFNRAGPSSKRNKRKHYSTDVVGCTVDRKGSPDKPFRILLDTGSTTSIALRWVCDSANVSSFKEHRTQYHTMGGTYETRRKCLLEFMLPEFSNSKTIKSSVNVDETHDRSEVRYDVIIGRDILTELGIVFDFNKKISYGTMYQFL